ncbi:3-oxo-5alpha-steroid 4-dehydrogenase [Exophiala viscosa]|uniref:3-oxo-5alpha-steroid 4-dehydrogenase n=1 Tax=Exophiala viscosa TaxID=2486360 RepID=UPI00218DCB7C|nr:3-oxo-5alpha-steroid 4-dehydrogenase [Exophiala viscosa]
MTMLDFATWTIRAFYTFSSITIIVVRFTPALRDRFLPYGARDVTAHRAGQFAKQPAWSVQVLDYAATWKVPHSWFIHFYIVSVTASTMGLCFFYPSNSIDRPDTTTICGTLMLVQGIRRLLECFFLTKPSQSRMWIGHYAIGVAFYIATNIAIWTARPDERELDFNRVSGRKVLAGGLWTFNVLAYVFLFFYASWMQNLFHRHLAGLRKYTLPDIGMFRTIIAPHYTAECAIYLSLAFCRDAHQGGLVDLTLFCALIFVVVNLGVTADGTREWMLAKFPEKNSEIERRWTMLPPVW